jgi:hypothetical protein
MGRPLLLLDAAYAYRDNSEDRLTELFACALDSRPGFCRELHDELTLPDGDRYLITAQHRVSPECRLDMRIEARSANGATTSVVYSEHKIEGGRHPQRPRVPYWPQSDLLVSPDSTRALGIVLTSCARGVLRGQQRVPVDVTADSGEVPPCPKIPSWPQGAADSHTRPVPTRRRGRPDQGRRCDRHALRI